MTNETNETPARPPLFAVAWLVYLILAVAGALWMAVREGGVALAPYLSRATWGWDLAWGLAGGLTLLGLWEAGRRYYPPARYLEATLRNILTGVTPADALSLALISGFAEEVFFRGALLGAFPTLGGLALSTAIFAALHTGKGPGFRTWTVFAAIAGLTFGALFLKTGNVLAPVVAHTLVNAVNLRRLALR